jgi:antitoxin component of RelBE/YafQ-DinJ toxin-antitoxin module
MPYQESALASTSVVRVTLGDPLHKRIAELAADNGLSVSATIRLFLVQHLRNTEGFEPRYQPQD